MLAWAARDGSARCPAGLVAVAAFLLAVMGLGREEEAFWTLCALCERRLAPAHFDGALTGCRVEQRTLCDLLRRRAPRVCALFDR